MLFILAIAGAAGFLGSVFLLWSGLNNMALRYALAVAISYLVFLALIRVWLAFHRRRWSLNLDVPAGGEGGSQAAPPLGGGGRFGGGGASGSFESPAVSASRPMLDVRPAPGGHGGAADLTSGLDLDEAWPVALVLLLVSGGVIALAFVIYSSPILFAEAALDAAVVSTVYRRVRRRTAQHWLTGVVRRTWIPAIALSLFVGLAGFTLQAAAPDARTLGGVLEALSAE